MESKVSSVSWFPQTSSEQSQVREQLMQILAHPLFNQSKRYPVMLRYVVEQTLLGNVDQLKERIIGIEAFDRDPQYDPSVDPIVRFTASEIRKRLAQYYVERAHSGELQIDLPVGSYAAVFRPRQDTREAVQTPRFHEPEDRNPTHVSTIEPSLTVNESLKQLSVSESVVAPIRRRTIGAKVVLTAVLAGVAGVCAGFLLHRPARQASSPMEQFWSALTAGPGIVTFCVGEPPVPVNAASNQTAGTGSAGASFWNDSSHLAISDVIALAHLTSALDSQGKTYRISAASQTNFFQLREGPVILIGAFDNPWTMRLMQNLRYTFVQKAGESASIVDSRNPTQSNWSLPFSPSAQTFSHDFGVVARFHDSTTGQPVVLVAGLAAAGTEAAGELLSNRAFFAEMMKDAPRNWPNMNMEVVLETQVIGGHPGPPKILAAAYW